MADNKLYNILKSIIQKLNTKISSISITGATASVSTSGGGATIDLTKVAPTAENFSGVLSMDKGGTGGSNGVPPTPVELPRDANLNDYKTPGFYRCSTNSHSISNVPTLNSAFILFVLPNTFTTQIVITHEVINSFIYIRNYYGYPVEQERWGNWTFCLLQDNQGPANEGYAVANIMHSNDGLLFGQAGTYTDPDETKAFIGVKEWAWNEAVNIQIKETKEGEIIGTYKGNEIATTPSVISTQLALASIYESQTPIKTLSIQSDTIIEQPSIDELSVLDENMIQVYTDLCLNSNSGKQLEDVPENLRPYVSKVIKERKDAEEEKLKKIKKEVKLNGQIA